MSNLVHSLGTGLIVDLDDPVSVTKYVAVLDADPDAHGGPSFDNADDLMAYLNDGEQS